MKSPRERWVLVRSLYLALLVSAWAVGGCYNPNIKNGGLLCAEAGAACPEGFSCVAGRCHKMGADAAPHDTKVDMGNDRSPDTVADGASLSDACVQRTGAADCVPQTDLTCDPVCQTKCCATQKCSALNTGAGAGTTASLGCVPNTPTRQLGERCDPSGAGTANRFDNCAPGLVCVEGNMGGYCLKLCRSNADCASTGTTCEARAIEPASGSALASVCTIAKTACNPTAAAIASSGCGAGLTCYLTGIDQANGDTTVCEISSGDLRNTTCRLSRECFPGYTCPQVGPRVGVCLPVCSLLTSSACPTGTTCQSLGKDYSYCF